MAECPDKQQRHSGVPGDDPWTECGRRPADSDAIVPCVGEEHCAVLRAEAWKVDAERLAEALRQVVRRGEDIGFPPGACGRCVEPAKDALAAHEKLKAEEA